MIHNILTLLLNKIEIQKRTPQMEIEYQIMIPNQHIDHLEMSIVSDSMLLIHKQKLERKNKIPLLKILAVNLDDGIIL